MSHVTCASAPRLMGSQIRLPFGIGYVVFSAGLSGADMARAARARLSRFLENRRAIALLSQMDERLLSDIGLSRGDVRDAADIGAFGHPMTVLDVRAADRAARAMERGARRG